MTMRCSASPTWPAMAAPSSNEIRTLAASAAPLARLGRRDEARKRLDKAFARLAEHKLYPAQQITWAAKPTKPCGPKPNSKLPNVEPKSTAICCRPSSPRPICPTPYRSPTSTATPPASTAKPASAPKPPASKPPPRTLASLGQETPQQPLHPPPNAVGQAGPGLSSCAPPNRIARSIPVAPPSPSKKRFRK